MTRLYIVWVECQCLSECMITV